MFVQVTETGLVIPVSPLLALLYFLLIQISYRCWLLTISAVTSLAGEAAFLLEIQVKLLLENSLGSRTQNAVQYHERDWFFFRGLHVVKLQLPNIHAEGNGLVCRRCPPSVAALIIGAVDSEKLPLAHTCF